MKRPPLPNTRTLLPGQWTEGDGYWTGGGFIQPRIHPQPCELAAQKWLLSIPALAGVDSAPGWRTLDGWDRKSDLIIISDAFSNLRGPFTVQNCTQIDVWAGTTERAEMLAATIWGAAEGTAGIARLREPQVLPRQDGRCSLDLEFQLTKGA